MLTPLFLPRLCAQRVINYRALIRTTATPKNLAKLPDELIENDAHLVRRRRPSTLDSVDSRALLKGDARNSSESFSNEGGDRHFRSC